MQSAERQKAIDMIVKKSSDYKKPPESSKLKEVLQGQKVELDNQRMK